MLHACKTISYHETLLSYNNRCIMYMKRAYIWIQIYFNFEFYEMEN